MRVGSPRLFAISVTLVASVLLAPSILAADSNFRSSSNGETTGVQVQSFHSHGRLTVSVDESVETELKTTANGFEVFLKGIGLSDLGAPLGEEQQWVSQFQSLREPRLATLNFKEVGGGLRIEGTWKYPVGKSALASPSMETFDFRKNTPAQYVLDFWLKPGPTLAEVEEKKNKAARQSKLEMADAASRLRASRRLASEKQKSDLEDVTRFCREPLSEATDIFLPIYPVHTKVSFSRWFPVTTPDSGYSYFEPAKGADGSPVGSPDGSKDKAAEYVRLALDLYRKGDPALVVRTLDFFDAEEPASEYRHEMRFLRANAMIRLGLQDAAEKKLREIVAEEKESPVSLLAAQYLAAKQYERGQFLAAAENFLWLETHYPNHRLAWVFHLGTAESLYALKQTERSAKEYQWIIENAQDNSDKAEAALRQGDLYMERFQYDQGLASYFQGLTYFKDEAKSFPAIFINRAEALYGLAQYDRAEEAFQAFLKDYPAHPAGWRATFRIGEIEGRKSEAAARDSSRKWFYDTINRFPTSPGATLARLRLLPCGDHGRFDKEAMERFFDGEAANFDGGVPAEIGMPKYRAFEALAHIRTLVTLGREPEAVELATDELRAMTAPDLRAVLGSALGAIFRRSVLSLLDTGKKYEALSLYEQKYDALPKPDLITDPGYLLTLSRTASDLGLGELGERINQSYLKADAALKSGPRAVAASSDGRDLESDLRASEKNFSEAKSAYVSSGGAPDVKTEGKIRELLATVESESRFSYEKELILGLLDQKKKEIPSALAHAARAQILSTSDPRDYRVDAWLGSLQAASGESAAALETYRNLEKHLELENATHSHPAAPAAKVDETIGLEPVPRLGEVLIAQSEILEKMNRWGDAATTYARAMDEGVGGDHAVYGYARALLRTGVHADRTKAYTVLQGLAKGKFKTKERAPAGGVQAPSGALQDEFWQRLAQEALANEQSEREILGPVTKEGSK